MADLRFDGRVAIVTGGGRGLGREYALLLAQRGASVVVNDVGAEIDGAGSSPQPAKDVAEEIVAAGGTAIASHASVADREGAASIVDAALDSFGRLDAVINNAGITTPLTPFADTPMEEFERHLDVHYRGTLYVCKAAWSHLIAAGAGRIVNTTSTSILGFTGMAGYGAAKGAVLALTRTLAVEGAPLGIRANAISPGAATRTVATPSAGPDPEPEDLRRFREWMIAAQPPHLVAPVVAFLAHEACPLNGETIVTSGGHVARQFIGETPGLGDRRLTIEKVQANLHRVLDEPGYRVFGDLMEQLRYLMVALGDVS